VLPENEELKDPSFHHQESKDLSQQQQQQEQQEQHQQQLQLLGAHPQAPVPAPQVDARLLSVVVEC